VIARGIKTFVEVGCALAKVRDSRLYRERYWNFADYCERRWKMSRQRGYELIEAAAVVKALPANLSGIPVNSEKALALAKFPPAERAPVLAQAAEAAATAGRKLTARDIREAAPKKLSANCGQKSPAPAEPTALSLATPAIEEIRRIPAEAINEKAALHLILTRVQERLSADQ
jgi:hypothetical protein